MIAVLSDTHGRRDHRLSGPAEEAVRAAAVVVHAGDFTTPAVLDAFEAASERLVAVHGNVDDPTVRSRLPRVASLEHRGVRIVVVHGDEHGETARAMLGREAEADVVVSGHSHRPGIVDTGDVLLLNPGSHADPRGGTAAHAEVAPTSDGFRLELLAETGDVLETLER